MDDKEYLIRLGEKIVALRKAKNIKQVDLAISIGIEDSALRRIEKGKVNSSILMLKKVANALNVSVEELINVK